MDSDFRRVQRPSGQPPQVPVLPGTPPAAQNVPPQSQPDGYPPVPPQQPPVTPQAAIPQPIEYPAGPPSTPPKKSSKLKKLLLWLSGGVILLIAVLGLVGWLWYNDQLKPVDEGNTERVVVRIVPNSSPSAIASQLKEADLIRSTDAFALYTRLSGTQNLLQAGSYRLSPSESTPKIVEHLTKGNVDTFDITFLPGATLEDHRKVLEEAGYTGAEIDEAFTSSYNSPIFEGRPDGADLEGYIFGETYRVSSGASVEQILQQSFAEFEAVIDENKLKEGFAAHDLSLYEGITLASIIQKEAGGGDEAQIAQVFYSRLAIDMMLGSDVTYQYIADKTGVKRDVNLDSPYNTRRYKGLPPGPISSPGVKALTAVANPAQGDYLFFLSGDDDVTYYARTVEEHEANISAHCQAKCQIL